MYVHIIYNIYICIYIYISGSCLHCMDLFHGLLFAQDGTARGRQRNPIARRCMDPLVKPRSMDGPDADTYIYIYIYYVSYMIYIYVYVQYITLYTYMYICIYIYISI